MKEPKKPERQIVEHSISFLDGDSLKDILDQITEKEIDLNDVIFNTEYGYYDETYYSFKYKAPEDINGYERKLKKYEEKFIKYNDWLKNKEKKNVKE